MTNIAIAIEVNPDTSVDFVQSPSNVWHAMPDEWGTEPCPYPLCVTYCGKYGGNWQSASRSMFLNPPWGRQCKVCAKRYATTEHAKGIKQ